MKKLFIASFLALAVFLLSNWSKLEANEK